MAERQALKRVDIGLGQVELPVDDLERVTEGEFLDQVGVAAVNELVHQPVNHRVDDRIAPGAHELGEEDLLEDPPPAPVLGVVHGADAALAERDPDVEPVDLVGEPVGVVQGLADFVGAENREQLAIGKERRMQAHPRAVIAFEN